MEPNVEEALRAKAYAEKHFAERDFTGAKNFALKAQKLCPELDGISQMVATFGVYTASEMRINGELDLYAILGLDPSADKGKVKKQYKKMAVLLHPDKNTSVGADGAFKLVSEAWTILSDHVKRSVYDQRRNLSVLHSSGIGSFDNNYSRSSVSHHRLDTFWTVCTSCHVQYEYLRKYVNKKLSCKNCRGVFIAVETGAAPANGSYPYSPWSYAPENGFGSHGHGATYIPTTSVYCTSNGVSGHHSGHGSEYVSNVTIQWNSFPGTPAGVLDPNGFSMSTIMTHQVDENANRAKANGRHYMKKTAVEMVSNGYDGCSEPPISKPGRPAKKRKVDAGGTCHIGYEEVSARSTTEVRAANGNGNLKQNAKLCSPTETSTRRTAAAPTFDARRMLIDKARSEIHKKVEEMKLALAAAEAEKKRKALAEVDKSGEAPKRSNSDGTSQQSELKRTVSMSITVPDSDFHDFDKDRSEECFKPKQVWALYDEEDGMPRLYCLIREVISVKPFKIYISYLSSKTDTEFWSVNWLDFGFTKSCGNVRVFNSKIVEQVDVAILVVELGRQFDTTNVHFASNHFVGDIIIVLPRDCIFPPSHYDILGIKKYSSVEKVTKASDKLIEKWNSDVELPSTIDFIKLLCLLGFSLFLLPIFKLLCLLVFQHRRWLVVDFKKVDWRGYFNSIIWNLNYGDKASTLAGEIEEASRTFPKVLLRAMVLVVISYFFPLLAGTGVLEPDPSVWSDGYFAEVGMRIGGFWLKWWIQAASAKSNLGLFEAEMIVDAFRPFGMSELGILPSIFPEE